MRSLEADPIKLGERLYDDVQLYCPLFQRRYVWGKAQIDQLWGDIDTILDGQYERRFLGALVFDDERPATAREAGQYWVIDGQQRLTTMVLTVTALAEQALKFGEEGEIIAHDLYSQYLVSNKRQSRNHPRLRPTLRDTKQFNNIHKQVFGRHEDVYIDVERQAGEEEGIMTRAYGLISQKIEQRTALDESGDLLPGHIVLERIDALRDVILDHLEFVEIRLGEQHDPNEVFDRLNNEGVKLGIIDLVRNDVLKRLKDNAHLALRMYSEEWQPFENGFPDNAAKTGYFFPFALTVDASITKASTFKRLTTHWSNITADDDMSPSLQLREIMRDLRRHQTSYNAINSAQTDGLDESLHEPLLRLNRLNRPSSVYPYVMQLVSAATGGDVSTTDSALCLRIIESFLVRRALLGIEPTGLHAVFKKLWKDAGADPTCVRRSITSTTVVFPSDEAVATAIATGNLYGRKIAPYVLAEYELSNTTGEIMKNLPDITIDHLLPKHFSDGWAEFFSPAQHAELVDTWANLVPLSQAANSAKGAKNWNDVRKKLQRETVFSTTKHVYDEYSEWTPEAMEGRSLEIQEWAIARWPSFRVLLEDVDLSSKKLQPENF